MKMKSTLKKYQGLSLVELMVALAVGLFLVAGVLQIYLGSRQSFLVQESLSRLQENGRFALMFMEEDIRMADYRGCGTRSARVPLNNVLVSNTNYLWNFAVGIEGYEAISASSWNSTPDSSINSPMGGRDILTVRRASPETYKVVTHAIGTDSVELNSGAAIETGDVVMTASCESAAVFVVTNESSGSLEHDASDDGDTKTPDNSTNDLGTGYANADIFRLDTVTYYIRNSGFTGRPSLYRKVGNSDAQELIQDVEDMQITYGEDTNTDALVDRYVSASAVSDWNNVISVNINLLLVTPEDNLTPTLNPQPYVFNGVNYDGVSGPLPGDNRLRQAFTSTTTLRNRTL